MFDFQPLHYLHPQKPLLYKLARDQHQQSMEGGSRIQAVLAACGCRRCLKWEIQVLCRENSVEPEQGQEPPYMWLTIECGDAVIMTMFCGFMVPIHTPEVGQAV